MGRVEGKLAIIPARGGSKRIPRKNIRPFQGRPIISYSIEAAVKSGLFSCIMVSTDDEEIASISVGLGAEVPFLRSQRNASDHATTSDVLDEVVSAYANNGVFFEHLCCIYPAAPFVTPDLLRESFSCMKDKGGGSLVPVTRFGSPVQRALRIDEGFLVRVWPEHELSRSQDLEPYYHDVGQFYWLDAPKFIQQKKLLLSPTVAFVVEPHLFQDIDDEADWSMAELKFSISRDWAG